MLISALKILVMPPTVLFVLGGFGFLVARRKPKLGRALVIGSAAALVLLTLPLVAALLLRSLQTAPPAEFESVVPAPGAVVVLAADSVIDAPEYGQDTLGSLSLVRVRYAALLVRETDLPILVSGGPARTGALALAEFMRAALEDEYGVGVSWIEDRSGNTRQNAKYSAMMLHEAEISRIYLVTHAWHMPRARGAFEAFGIEVVPAPTGFRTWPGIGLREFLPSAQAFQESTWALHECVGLVWYQVVALKKFLIG